MEVLIVLCLCVVSFVGGCFCEAKYGSKVAADIKAVESKASAVETDIKK